MREAFEHYLAEKSLGVGALGIYRRSFRRFSEWVEASPSTRTIDEITSLTRTINAYQEALATKAVRAPVSEVKVAKIALNHLLRCALGQ